MAVYHFLGVAALLLSTTLASPIDHLATRNITVIEAGLRCGNFPYTNAEAQDAFADAISHLRAGTSYNSATNTFPGVFRNGGTHEEVDAGSCRGLTLYEFPIRQDGREYTGGAPGPDRVVVAESARKHGAYEQCFLMTHTGAGGNLFVRCT
ncbi:Ribonuclease/ribotoxin [Stipitochalara longipes BDJ]|nr:Ribonuclease/ribotoxin [Stipitochalara longipes BDJ]